MIIGIIGCGSIASIISHYFKKNDEIEIKYLYDKNFDNAKCLAEDTGCVPVRDIAEMFSDVDLVVEAAAPVAVKEYMPSILSKGIDVIIMSVGALMDVEFRDELEDLARSNNCKIHLPSGAIAGVDAVNAALVGDITSLNIVTRKPPESLGLDVDEETIVFDGKSSQAVKEFPANINVSATLSIGSKRDVDVKIIADPKVKRNIHTVTLEGTLGNVTTISENLSCEDNPKTSRLAAFSAIKLLEKLCDTIIVGT